MGTIGLVRSFGPEKDREHFYYRPDMTPNGLKILVKNFVDQMEESQKKMIELLPKSIFDGWKKYSDLVRSSEYKTFTPEVKILARRKLSLLKDILTLPVYSWVSFTKIN